MYKTFLMLALASCTNFSVIFPAKLRNLINKNAGEKAIIKVYSSCMPIVKGVGFQPAYSRVMSPRGQERVQELNVIVMPEDTLFINKEKVEVGDDGLVFDVEIENQYIKIIPISMK